MSRKKSELMQRIKDGTEVNGEAAAATTFSATLEKRVEEELKVR